MIDTRGIRNELHAIDLEILRLEDELAKHDDEYEWVNLPLVCKRRRRIVSRRYAEERQDADPFWADQAPLMIGSLLDELLVKRQAVYGRLRAAYLTEKGRLMPAAWDQLAAALVDPAIPLTVLSVDQQVALALRQVPRDHVPDMPDRIIAATALAYRLPLVTRDRSIRAAAIVPTIW